MSDDASQLPAIAISRTSTESRASASSSKKSTKQPVPKPPSPHGINTNNERNRRDHRWYPKQGQRPWKHDRGRASPDLEWHIKWNRNCFPNGRVLIIDYISNDTEQHLETPNGKRHIAVAAQEFETIKALKSFYADSRRVHCAALRVIHVQNATWATKFLLEKFNIDHPSELLGMQGFSRWARYEKPRQRNGKPFPNGRSFRTQMDPWRNISRTAFGLDYLKCYPTPARINRRKTRVFGDRPIDAQMMHLNAYEDGKSPLGYDVSVQRLSVYVQRSLGPPGRVSPADDVKNPYAKQGAGEYHMTDDDGKVYLESLDNTNTVIVFETSASMLMEDCLVQPRNDFEKRWRRLSFYLRKEEALNDARLAAQCTNLILGDIFHGLAIVWEEFLVIATDHVNILEDKIYENPADESRAPELWTNQASWLKVDKIMWIHQDLIRESQGQLRELADVELEDEEYVHPPPVIEWLASTPTEYEKLSHSVQEDLVQPTANLSDLMYKSVGIRDSRQSLQLGLSMWRLSWITFIFLPLTFIVGFFGMNVNIFQDDPSVGWYFLAAAVLMLLVLVLWYCVKHSLQRKRQTPYQRGAYELLFHEMEDEFPLLWSHANGAADEVEPKNFANRIRWRLLKRWFAPEKTIDKKLYTSLADSESADLGSWAGLKRVLLRRWLPKIQRDESFVQGDPIALAEIGSSRPSFHSMRFDSGAVQQLAKMSTPVAVADAEPEAIQQISAYGLQPLILSGRRSSSGSPRHSTEERPSSRGSSGIMIEERNLSDSESEVGEGPTEQQHAQRL